MIKVLVFFALLVGAFTEDATIDNAGDVQITEERELYTDQRCPDCWRAVHERIDEMTKYQYPDYETAFWTCCYQCYGQEGDHIPGNADDYGNHRRLQSLRPNGDGSRWGPGNKKYGDRGLAPTFEQDPGRQCPEEYTRHHYETLGVPTRYNNQGATRYVPQAAPVVHTRNTYLSRWNNQ